MLIYLLACLGLFDCALADWQANTTTRIINQDQKQTEIHAKVFFKKDKMRADTKMPTDTSIIVDLKNKKAVTLVHFVKIHFSNSFQEVQNQIPHCADLSTVKSIEDCLKKNKFKIIKDETVHGLDCHVYEGKVKDGRVTLWKPKTLKHVPAVQSVFKSKSGKIIETVFEQVNEAPIEDGLFHVPTDYKKAKGVENLLKGFQR